MARGENNILYNPPRIKKIPSKRISWLASGQFAGRAFGVFLGQDLVGNELSLSVQEMEDDNFLLRSAIGEERHQRDVPCLDTPYSLNSQGLCWFLGKDIYLQDSLGAIQEPYHYPIDLKDDEKISDLHVTRRHIYYLTENEDGTFSLYSLLRQPAKVTAPSSGGGELLERGQGILTASYIKLEKRGDEMIIAFSRSKDLVPGEIDTLITVSDEGVGDTIYLDQDTTLSLRALDTSGQRYLAPGVRDGDYYYLASDGGYLPAEDRLLYLDGESGEKKVLDHVTRGDTLTLRSNGGRLALLGKESLNLYDQNGLVSKMTLPLDTFYNGLSFFGDQFFLWQRAGRNYLKLIFK